MTKSATEDILNEKLHFLCSATSYGCSQIISDPSLILSNSSSCIELIFTNQPKLVIESGVHPFLHPNCHHQIIFAKRNLKIEYSSLYECLIWDYKNAYEQLSNWNRKF